MRDPSFVRDPLFKAGKKMTKKISWKTKRFKIEPTMRFELTTSSLPRKHSTPELSRQEFKKKSQAAVMVVIS